MPTSTQESGRERRILLESLQAFSRGDGDAPMVTKWTVASESRPSLDPDCPLKDFHIEVPSDKDQDQAITFVLSTDDVDRHGDVISADGWVLDAYRENPVLLWATTTGTQPSAGPPRCGRNPTGCWPTWNSRPRNLPRRSHLCTAPGSSWGSPWDSSPCALRKEGTKRLGLSSGSGSWSRNCWRSVPFRSPPTGAPYAVRTGPALVH